MKEKILIGMRGGIGDIVIFSSVLERFREQNPSSHIICGTSKGCEKLARSIPFFDDFIIDFRPRYARPHAGSYFYKDRRTGFRLDDISRYYCLDHPYRGADYETNNNVHIIEMAARILGVTEYERRGKVFLTEANEMVANAIVGDKKFVLLAPLCSQSMKTPDFRLMGTICEAFQNLGIEVLCAIVDKDIPEIPCEKIQVKSILDLAAIIRRSMYYVGLDSGLSHMAAAFFRPMSTIHIGYSIKRSGVLNDKANVMPFPSKSIRKHEWPEICEKVLAHYKSILT